MHLLLGATNSEIPPLDIATRRQVADYRMSIHHSMSMNHPSSYLQYFNQSGQGGSGVETLIKFHPTEVAQIDDLSAVVTKCTNLKVLDNLYPHPHLIPRNGCRSLNSITHVYSQDSIESDNKEKGYCSHIAAKAAPPTPQFLSNKRRADVEDEEYRKYKVLKRNQCGPQTNAIISDREIHILSERRRRSTMNQLFSKIHSLLPDQTVKTDKISSVAETINYIHHLQQRLRTRTNKRAGGAHTAGSSQSQLTDTILSTTGSLDYAILPEISVNSHAGKDLFITIKCAKKGNLLPSIILVVERQNLEVKDAFVSTNDTVAFHCLHLKAVHTLDAAGRKALTDALHMLMKPEPQINLEP